MPETYKEHSYEQIKEALNNEKSAKEYYEKGINVLNKYIDEVKSKENLFWKDATKPFEELKTKLKTLNYESVWTEYGRSHKNNINMVADHISAVEKNVLSNLKKQREEKQKQDKIKQTQMDRNSSIYSAMNISVSEKTGIQFSRLIQTDNNADGKTGELYDDNPNLDSNANTNLGGFYFREAVNNIQAKTVLNKLFSTNKNALFEVSYDQCSNSNIRKRMLDGGVKYLLCKDGKYVYANENKQILNITPAFWYGVHLKDIGTVINGEFKESTFITNKKEQEKKEDEKQKEQNELKKQEIDKKIQSILQGIKLVSFNNEQGYNITNSITKLFHDRNQYENYLTSGDLQPLLDFRDNISDNNPFNPQDLINIVEEIIKNISTMKKRNQETAKLVQTGFFEESTNGTLECTKAVNSYTINQIGLKKDQVYQIDYSFMTNPTLKERISKYKTGDYPIFMMKYDTVINGFVLIDEKGTVLSEEGKYIRPPVWEGVNINNTKNIEIKAKINHRVQQNEQRRSEEARIKELKSETIQIDLPEEERKEALDAIPFHLKEKIYNYLKDKNPDTKGDFKNNEMLDKLVTMTEIRLNQICMKMSEQGYRLAIDSVSKKWGENGLMELHFINGMEEKDISMWTDIGTNPDEQDSKVSLGQELAKFLGDGGILGYDSNESLYMQYLQKRVGIKMEKFGSLKPKTFCQDVEVNIDDDKKQEKLEQQKGKFEKMFKGCSLLKTYIDNARTKEGDTISDYDKILVGALEQIEKIENTMEKAKEQQILLDIDKMLSPFASLFAERVQSKQWQNFVGLSFISLFREDPKKGLEKLFRQIFLGESEEQGAGSLPDDPQNLGVRTLAQLLSVYDVTESSSTADDSLLSETFNLDDEDMNAFRKNIDSVFSTPEKIDKLYQAYSREDVRNQLKGKIEIKNNKTEYEGVIKEDYLETKEVENGCKTLYRKIQEKKKMIEKVQGQMGSEEFWQEKMKEKWDRLNQLESNMSNLNEEEQNELAGLQRLKNDPTFYDAMKSQAPQMLQAMKYLGFSNDIKLSLASHFLDNSSSNSNLVNDRFGVGRFDFSDENVKIIGDTCIDIAIDIAVGVLTGGIGNSIVSLSTKLASKLFSKLNKIKWLGKFGKAEMKVFEWYAVRIGETIEQTVNLTLTRSVQNIKNGTYDQIIDYADIPDLMKTVTLTKGMGDLHNILQGGLALVTSRTLGKDRISSKLKEISKQHDKWLVNKGQKFVENHGKKRENKVNVGIKGIKLVEQGLLTTAEGKMLDDFLTNTLVDAGIKEESDRRDYSDGWFQLPPNAIKGIVKTLGIHVLQNKMPGLVGAQLDDNGDIVIAKKKLGDKIDDIKENNQSIGLNFNEWNNTNITFTDQQRNDAALLAGYSVLRQAAGETESSTTETPPESEETPKEETPEEELPSEETSKQRDTVQMPSQTTNPLNPNQTTNANQ